MSTLKEIENWFKSNCNGNWEHDPGITIETTDNPGWWVKINIENTSLSGKPFETISQGVNDDGNYLSFEESWITCYLSGHTFNGAGDPNKLEQILGEFLKWAKKYAG